MSLLGAWLALLGSVALCPLGRVSAETQISDPNLAVIREFNVVLTDNTKISDLSCCMGTDHALPSVGQYWCYDFQPLELGTAPGSRRVGIQYCTHMPDSTPQDAINAFQKSCTAATGELITPEKGYCPQRWPNYDSNYHKPAPPLPPSADKSPPPPPATPDESGKHTNDKEGFKMQGTFHYSLVDYSITRSLSCCRAATAPIITPHEYKCAQRRVPKSVFMKQCAQILPTITNRKKLDGYTTLTGQSDAIVDDETKQQCSIMWTNAETYTYGFCRLNYDYVAKEARQAFDDDCTAKKGEPKDPHHGMCLWNVDDAADDDSGTA